MAKRYVRVESLTGQIYYGLLQVNHAVLVLDGPPWLSGQLTELSLGAGEYRLLAPCTPSKIVAVGKNYVAHAAEMGGEVPSEPLLFLKPPSTIIADGEAIACPPQSSRVDYEGELALVIGAVCCDCTPEQAHGKIWGYTIANDVTARDLQKPGPWARAKGFDTFCPLGPWIVREVMAGALLQTRLQSAPGPSSRSQPTVVQSAKLDQMVYSPDVLVAFISQIMTLYPGDVILTGTPEGVGSLTPGDRVEIEIEGIGCLSNPVSQRLSPTEAV